MRVDGVSKASRDGETETVVIEGAAFALVRGERASLVGSSGSGKSTLIALLAGLLLPDSGSVLFDGLDLAALDDTARARLRAHRIGIVLQRGNLIPFLSAAENVELALRLAGRRQTRARARALLAELGLGGRLRHRPHALSGGEAQRVAVAVALANEPDLLLADEVTGELDSATSGQVMDVIFEALRARGASVLYVTHSEELAARAERRFGLSDGAVHPL